MQIINNKILLLNLRNPNKVTTVIPKSKQLEGNQVAVNWGLDEARVLNNLQIKNIPSPIMGHYNWTHVLLAIHLLSIPMLKMANYG